MSPSPEPPDPPKPAGLPEPPNPLESADVETRRRRIAAVFGDVLPETTGDDRDPEPPPDPERWYAENRPPHHDRH